MTTLLELHIDLLFSILDKLSWKNLLTFSSTCTKFNTLHYAILEILKTDETYKSNSKTIVYGFLIRNDENRFYRGFYYCHNQCFVPQNLQNIPEYTVFTIDKPFDICIQTLHVQKIIYYEELIQESCIYQQILKSNEVINIMKCKCEYNDNIMTGAIIFDSDIKIPKLYNLLLNSMC